MSICPNDVFIKTGNLIERKIGSALVLVPLLPTNTNEPCIFSLEGVAKEIWWLIDGKRKITEIMEELLRQFTVEKLQLLTDILEFIERLKMIGGIQICQSAQIYQK